MPTEIIDLSKAPPGATRVACIWGRPGKGKALEILHPHSGEWKPLDNGVAAAQFIHDSVELTNPEWDGEGLPPVGTKIEWFDSCQRWLLGEVVFVSAWVLVIRDINPHPDGSVDIAFDLTDTAPALRPMPTAAQIAAEEREKAAKQICLDAGSPELTAGQMAIAYRLYDAGYRKADPAGAQP